MIVVALQLLMYKRGIVSRHNVIIFMSAPTKPDVDPISAGDVVLEYQVCITCEGLMKDARTQTRHTANMTPTEELDGTMLNRQY